MRQTISSNRLTCSTATSSAQLRRMGTTHRCAIAAMAGLDEGRYDIVGFQFAHKALRGKPGLTIFAVDREVLGLLTLAQYGSRHGEIPVVDFLVHGTPALEILAASLKRLQVQLLSRNLPDGVPIRRAERDDLGR